MGEDAGYKLSVSGGGSPRPPRAPFLPGGGMGLSLGRKFTLTVMALLGLIGANVLLFQHSLDALNGVADTINAAGRMRMLSQKIGYEATLAGRDPDKARKRIDAMVEEMERGLTALARGGDAFGLAIRRLPPELADRIRDVRRDFHDLRVDVGFILAPENQPVAGEMILHAAEDAERLLGGIDAIVYALTFRARQDEYHARITLYGLAAANLALLAALLFGVYSRIVGPLRRMVGQSRAFAAGNFHERVTVDTGDELGELGRALNAMAENTLSHLSHLRKLSGAVEQSPAAVLITDGAGRIEYVNPRFSTMTGYGAPEARGQTPRLLKSGLTSPAVYRDMWGSLESGREWRGEILNRRKNGELVWVYQSISPLKDEAGRVTHYISVSEDVTPYKAAGEEMQRMNGMLRLRSRCNEALVHAADEQELVRTICRHITEIGGYPCVMVGYPRADDPGLLRTVAHSGQSCSADFSLGCEEGRHIRLPLVEKDAVFGVIQIMRRDGEEMHGDEFDLLKEIADDLAFGIATRRAAELQRQAEANLRLRDRAIESSSNAILIMDARRSRWPVIYANPAVEKITGYGAAEMIGHNPRILYRGQRRQLGLVEIRAGLRAKREIRSVALRCRRKNGEMFWGDLSISPVHDDQGGVTHFVTVINDVTERMRYQEELAQQANHDALTGLANRNLLTDRLGQAIARAERQGRQLALIFFDLDHFKYINDSMGHLAGDGVVQEVARRLAACVREGDTVARMGGDEFVLVLSDVNAEPEVGVTLQRIQTAIARPVVINGSELRVTCSMGVSLYPRDGLNPEELLKNADAAMYRAKELGRNQFQLYTAEINARVVERVSLEHSLREALDRGQFLLHFQPQVDLRSGEVVGAEALVRWNHPEWGLVPPGRFIPLAEETGLIVPLGEWVLDAACAQASAWQRQGLRPVRMAVNLSARQLRQGNLDRLVLQALKLNELEPRWLDLELTESMLMQEPDEAARILERLKQTGIRLSLDDFGTGYSSLNYLKRFPMDMLKLDRAFVRDITEDPRDAAIARAVIAMSHDMSLRVIAEGVENEGQLNYLSRQGCDELQGYYFSPPLPAADMARMLQADRRLGRSGKDVQGALLVVDDDPSSCRVLAELLGRDGYQVLVANGGQEALRILALQDVRMVISDQRMPGMPGTELLSRVRRLYPGVLRILTSAHDDLEAVVDAINRGAVSKFIPKPWNVEAVRDQVRQVFAARAAGPGDGSAGQQDMKGQGPEA